jgi:hypothetical protein
MNNKPQKYKETERFSIRRLTFWLSVSGTVYFAGIWEPTGMVIFLAVLILTLISKAISMSKEKESNRKD